MFGEVMYIFNARHGPFFCKDTQTYSVFLICCLAYMYPFNIFVSYNE